MFSSLSLLCVKHCPVFLNLPPFQPALGTAPSNETKYDDDDDSQQLGWERFFFIQRSSDSLHLKFLRHIYERKRYTFFVLGRPFFNNDAFRCSPCRRGRRRLLKCWFRKNLSSLLLPFCVCCSPRVASVVGTHHSTQEVSLAIFSSSQTRLHSFVQCMLYSAASSLSSTSAIPANRTVKALLL